MLVASTNPLMMVVKTGTANRQKATADVINAVFSLFSKSPIRRILRRWGWMPQPQRRHSRRRSLQMWRVLCPLRHQLTKSAWSSWACQVTHDSSDNSADFARSCERWLAYLDFANQVENVTAEHEDVLRMVFFAWCPPLDRFLFSGKSPLPYTPMTLIASKGGFLGSCKTLRSCRNSTLLCWIDLPSINWMAAPSKTDVDTEELISPWSMFNLLFLNYFLSSLGVYAGY